MRLLRRSTPETRTASIDTRVTNLERRHTPDYPIWGSMMCNQLSGIQNADTYEFDPTFPSDDPCVLPGCDPDDWRVTTDGYLLLPSGYRGVIECFITTLLIGGNANLDDYYTVLDAADQSINGQCRNRLIVEIWRNDAPFGFLTGRGYSSFDEYPPPTGIGVIDRKWVHHTLVPNNGAFDEATDRYALKPVFDVNQALPGTITVQPTLVAAAHVPGSRTPGIGDLQ